jgi:hypothetical protein
MNAVRPAQKARGARMTGLATTITRAIEVRSTSRYDGRHLLSAAEIREEPDDVRAGGVASRPQELARGFVDFLLGRGARHRR